jgi:hypothetical protein
MKFARQALLVAVATCIASSNAFHTPTRRATASFRRPTTSSTSIAAFPEINADIIQTTLSSTLTQLQSQISQLQSQLPASVSISSVNELQALLQSLPAELAQLDDTVLAIAAILITAPLSVISLINAPLKNDQSPYPPGTATYNPTIAAEFYGRRPLLVLQRILRLAFLTSQFNTGILFDWLILGKLFKDEEYTALKKNEPARAVEALSLCTQLGPTFIKYLRYRTSD